MTEQYQMPLSRRILLAAGAVMIAGGLGVLSHVGYTILDGGDDREENVLDLGDDGLAEEILDLPRPTPSQAPATPAPTPVPPLGQDAPYQMVIERIGVNAPVKTYGLDEEAVPEVPLGDEAREVVAWYNFSQRPGTGGNAVFAGHVTWNGQAVFYNLDQLQSGDTIGLISQDGTELVYSVTSVFSVDPDDKDSLKIMYNTAKDVITLITCGGSFTRNGDPTFGGEYSQRLVVRGDLVSVSRAASAGGG